jgi:hypothetical protein
MLCARTVTSTGLDRAPERLLDGPHVLADLTVPWKPYSCGLAYLTGVETMPVTVRPSAKTSRPIELRSRPVRTFSTCPESFSAARRLELHRQALDADLHLGLQALVEALQPRHDLALAGHVELDHAGTLRMYWLSTVATEAGMSGV